MTGDYASIDVDALETAVDALDDTLTALDTLVAPLERDFEYFGVDTTHLKKLLAARDELTDVVPELRERHRLARQLLSEYASHPALGGGTVVGFEGDLLDDLELTHRADIAESIELLQAEGVIGEYATTMHREWISWTLQTGLTPADMVERARQEGVDQNTFDLLRDVTIWRTPDGRPYARIEDAGDAREIVRLIELLNGGTPSTTDERRDANSWSYSSLFGLRNGDVGLVLNNGGALVATPEGILMAAPGGKHLGIIPNTVDIFSARGGTMWGEIFVLNGSHDDPASILEDTITNGVPPPGSGAPSLERLLRHERVHAEQWARLGYTRFIWEYLTNGPSNPCEHPLEIEAGLADGGYRCSCGGGCGN
ncbi:hypothetical protein [Phytoactinopolyspora limicola]|uniref:hypothetical protein n=1 Tax=Phytoactinopolyspora limicola TaxID=2715536 RepID=UPI00140ACF33|nr:hypothetical protein [Phytoactinopolyspora limicola]